MKKNALIVVLALFAVAASGYAFMQKREVAALRNSIAEVQARAAAEKQRVAAMLQQQLELATRTMAKIKK